MSLKVIGLKDAKAILEVIAPREAHNLMRATIHDVTNSIRDDSRADAPVGAQKTLKKDIRTKREKARSGWAESTLRIARRSFYWRFSERGTKTQTGKHYIRNAAFKARGELQSRFLSAFGRKLEAALARKRKGARR